MTRNQSASRVSHGRSAAAILVLAGLAAAAPAAGLAQTAAEPEVTFARDIAPLLQQHCQTCHREGSMAPMSLVTYAETRPWARAIKNRVIAREMPPWHLDKTVGIQQFVNDISLSDEQIDRVVRWVDAGAPLGDPADMPPPATWPDDDRFRLEAELGPPDIVVRGVPWTMPAEAQDAWFTPVVEIDLPESVWVRAAETKPSLAGRPIAHHASTYLYQPKSPELLAAERALRSGEGTVEDVIRAATEQEHADGLEEVREFFTEWAQGKDGEVYPDNVGKIVQAGAKVEFEVHYHAVGYEVTDVMESAWWLYPQDSPPKYNAQFVAVGITAGQLLEIPPNSVTETKGTYVMPAPGIFHNFQPHMHFRGKAFLMEAIYPNGRREVLNYTSQFDNTWHLNYVYDPDYAPLLPKGTVVEITAWHDNTAANRNNPDPRQWVAYGQRTVDDMAHANQQVIFITQEDYEHLRAEREARDAQAATQNQN